MKFTSFSKLLVSLSVFVCASLSAAPLTVDISGAQSIGAFGDSRNTVLTLDVGANSRITSVDFDVNVTAFSPSWLDEIGLAFTDSAITDGVLLRPGNGDWFPGTASYANYIDLILEGLDFAVGADGILRLEFYENFDDSSISPDGLWNFGTITFGIETVGGEEPGEVPEPATGLLLGAGLAMLAYGKRRRRSAAAH